MKAVNSTAFDWRLALVRIARGEQRRSEEAFNTPSPDVWTWRGLELTSSLQERHCWSTLR
jgi:hypothetical protein